MNLDDQGLIPSLTPAYADGLKVVYEYVSYYSRSAETDTVIVKCETHFLIINLFKMINNTNFDQTNLPRTITVLDTSRIANAIHVEMKFYVS